MFVIKDNKTLVEMKPASFATEAVFQQLLAEFPALLSGEQIDRESPRRWILVAREKSVPSEDGGAGRWSVDHLFLDQDGIPTIVEVKRQSDTRIRREVVGQMLDYAANGVAYWPVGEIKDLFVATCLANSSDPSQKITDLLSPDDSEDEFWGRVKTNLQAGKIRMLFVADLIPPELRKIVEFLNKQMDPAEILALELKQFEGEGGLRTLVPRLYGQTEEALQRKGGSSERRNWDEFQIYEEMERRSGPNAVKVARKIAEWIKNKSDQRLFGHGKVDGSMLAFFCRSVGNFTPLSLVTSGRVYINFGYCMKRPFDDEKKRLEWLSRLNQIDGVNFQCSLANKYPPILLKDLEDEVQFEKFMSAMDWFVSELPK
jgi:hypothetical protein